LLFGFSTLLALLWDGYIPMLGHEFLFYYLYDKEGMCHDLKYIIRVTILITSLTESIFFGLNLRRSKLSQG
jgi:hypothetical protein